MALAQPLSLPYTCSAHALGLPSVFGAKILSVEATAVHNYSSYVFEGYYPNHASVNATDISFCNVTVTYTHPGQDDCITTQIWLPTNNWNERMQAVGGGGWLAGMDFVAMTGAIGEGYAAITTDGGHTSANPEDWALLSPGKVDLHALQNFGSVSLNDLAIIGKSLVQSFYGAPPKFSYWSGCSQGGRQGHMLAQRYPNAFDGIAASAPAINWGQQFIADFWPQQFMNELGQYPHPCELDALTAAAIEACDGNDGLMDGLISDPDSCQFDAYTLVNAPVNCSKIGTCMRVSKLAAMVATAVWTGPQTANGTFLWYGPGYDAVLTGATSPVLTECNASGQCDGKPLNYSTDWIRLFIRKDPAFIVSNLTRADFEEIFHTSVHQFSYILGTSDPNLGEFRDAGGKMLTYHGLADDIIPSKNTRHYYNAVAAEDPSVHSYFRLFESPGLAHCYGGNGVYPSGIFHSLVKWVESGIAPDVLEGSSLPDQNGFQKSRILCPYPQRAHYKGEGDSESPDSFYCATLGKNMPKGGENSLTEDVEICWGSSEQNYEAISEGKLTFHLKYGPLAIINNHDQNRSTLATSASSTH